MEPVFHRGELLAQEKAQEQEMARRNGKVIIPAILPGAVNFIEKSPLTIVSSQNASGEISVSPLAGETGYIRVIDERTIEIDPSLLTVNPKDILWENVAMHENAGLLFIEPFTRRRYRLNGRFGSVGDKFQLTVHQAYPNCPKYVQQRDFDVAAKPVYQSQADQGDQLTPSITSMLARTDTLFVGSSDDLGNLDASHRGGLPGFIHVANASTLLIPDYTGNSMFNTLGNFLVNSNAGLLVLDFEQHQALQISGEAKITWHAEHPMVNTAGTNRYWTVTVKHWTLMENLKGHQEQFIAYSKFNPPTK